jgi:hypothetical protein
MQVQDRTEHPHVLSHSQRMLPATFFLLASYPYPLVLYHQACLLYVFS